MREVPSLQVVRNQVERELDNQLRHFEALDTKAGIVLGFSGAIVALTVPPRGWLSAIGLVLAAVAAFLSLLTFHPRNYPVMDVAELRDKYIRSEAAFTELHVLDSSIEMSLRAAELLRTKAAIVKWGVRSLATSVILLAGGLLFKV